MTRLPWLLLMLVFPLGSASADTSGDAPLPDPRELKQRAIISLKNSEQELEKYSCLVNGQTDELNSDGSVKRHKSTAEERFFVNGIEINHVLKRDGKSLAENDAKKEQERVDKEVKKFSDPGQAQKATDHDEKQADMVLRALRFKNGHREMRDGRKTVVYDLEGDPAFHPRKVEERFAQALMGRIWMDEEAGAPVELKAETRRDVKVGGGLLATVHKGFQIHFTQQREPGGAWITKSFDGNLDARAALFLHPRIRFREDLEKCHIFSVSTQEKIGAPADGEPRK